MLSLVLVIRLLDLRKSSLSKHHEKTNYKENYESSAPNLLFMVLFILYRSNFVDERG